MYEYTSIKTNMCSMLFDTGIMFYCVYGLIKSHLPVYLSCFTHHCDLYQIVMKTPDFHQDHMLCDTTSDCNLNKHQTK